MAVTEYAIVPTQPEPLAIEIKGGVLKERLSLQALLIHLFQQNMRGTMLNSPMSFNEYLQTEPAAELLRERIINISIDRESPL